MLGGAFFRNFYTVFDEDSKRIGIGMLRNSQSSITEYSIGNGGDNSSKKKKVPAWAVVVIVLCFILPVAGGLFYYYKRYKEESIRR